MSIALHWYLPTHGDGRTLLEAGAAAQLLRADRRADSFGAGREATLDYLAQGARAAEQSGFDAVLTPTGTTCHDAWITCAALSQVVDRLRFLVAFRPGAISPTLAAQQAATFQRHTGGRLLLNIVTGGDDEEQRRFGDRLGKDERYARTDEFLTILRGAWSGEPFDFAGEHLWAEGATALGIEEAPAIYFGGASEAALRVAARHADVALTWGDPPPKLPSHLEVYPNLWAGIGLLRTGAGTAMVGSHEQIADLMAEYHELGISEFILSGYPHVEEAYAFGEGVVPVLRERGLIGDPVAA